MQKPQQQSQQTGAHGVMGKHRVNVSLQPQMQLNCVNAYPQHHPIMTNQPEELLTLQPHQMMQKNYNNVLVGAPQSQLQPQYVQSQHQMIYQQQHQIYSLTQSSALRVNSSTS